MGKDIEKELVEQHGWDPTWFKTVPETEARLIARHDQEHERPDKQPRRGYVEHNHDEPTYKVNIDVNLGLET